MGRTKVQLSTARAFPAALGWFRFKYGPWWYYIRAAGKGMQGFRFSVNPNSKCRKVYKGMKNFCGASNGGHIKTPVDNGKPCWNNKKPCVFPFKKNGKTCAGPGCCNLDNDSKGNWCSTKVDSKGVHIGGHFVYCKGTPCRHKTWTAGKKDFVSQEDVTEQQQGEDEEVEEEVPAEFQDKDQQDEEVNDEQDEDNE